MKTFVILLDDLHEMSVTAQRIEMVDNRVTLFNDVSDRVGIFNLDAIKGVVALDACPNAKEL